MPHIACPTCLHGFDVDKSQLDAIISCPNCNLSLRACDNLVPDPASANGDPSTDVGPTTTPPIISEQLRSWWQRLSPQQKQGSVGGTTLAVIVLLVIVVNSGSETQSKSTEQPIVPETSKRVHKEWIIEPEIPGSPSYSSSPTNRVQPTPRRGQIDWAITQKARRSWQNGDFRNADRAEQIAAMMVILAGVEKAIPDPLDREATLDYIQRNIDSW